MTSKWLGLVFVAATLVLNISTAAAVTIDFDQVSGLAAVNNFYNGGTDSFGGSGPNLGIGFTGLIAATPANSGFTSAPSPPQVGISINGGAFSVNIPSGTNSISFKAETSDHLVVLAFSGLSSSGTLVGMIDVPASQFSFATQIFGFSGTAESFDFFSPGSVAIDDLQIATTAPVTTTPLPTTLPLFATGLGALGLLGWRRKRNAT